MGLVEVIGISIAILLLILIVGIGILIFLQTNKLKESENKIEAKENERSRLSEENIILKNEAVEKEQKITDLQNKLNTVTSERDTLTGNLTSKNQELISLKLKQEVISSENVNLKEEIAVFKSEKENYNKQINEKITQLNNSQITLEQERARVIKNDEEKKKQELEKLDCVWKEHEDKVIAKLTELCQRQEISFMFHDNKNLPSDWDGILQPDFMIQFLGQYLIFDAKLSKNPEGLQSNIANKQVESTYKKINSNAKVYSTIYLVVPAEAISFISQFHYFVHGYNFFVITTESLEPLLLNLKQITKYDLTDKFDPQDRESIINTISELDYHINLRNAADLTLTQWGVDTLERAKNFNPDIFKEVASKKEKMDIKAINKSHLKRFMVNTKSQQDEIDKLTTPVAPVSNNDIKEASSLLLEDCSKDSSS